MKIVRAESTDAQRLSEIARAAKGLWDYPPEWLEAWRDSLTLTAEFVRQNETYKALHAGALVGFSALIVNKGKLCLDHLWVVPEMVGWGNWPPAFRACVETRRRNGFR